MEFAHIVMIPFPAQGHQNPMMRLACRLVKSGGIRITFFTSEWFVKSALGSREHAYEHLIRVESIAGGTLEADEMKGNSSAVVKMILEAKEMAKPFEFALRRILEEEEGGIQCLISDAFVDWPQDVANKLGIPRVGLWTSGTPAAAQYFLLGYLIDEGYVPVQEKLEKSGNVPMVGIPGQGNAHVQDLPFLFYPTDEEGLKMEAEIAKAMKEAVCILLSTFEDLEKKVIDGLRTLLPNCWPIGPLLPNKILDADEDQEHEECQAIPSFRFGDLEEDQECLKWLDGQEPRSVLYISFGSLANISVKQIEELALGLEASEMPFLWAIRPSLVDGLNESQVFMDFVDRVTNQEKSLLVSWAPQLALLAHKSVALFLSHCGWNSCTEAIWYGVPVLAWPCFGEQNVNARSMVKDFCIGNAISEELLGDPHEFVSREQVASVIRSSKGDEGIQKKMSSVKDMARKAAKQGGDSFANMEKLVQAMRSGDWATKNNP